MTVRILIVDDEKFGGQLEKMIRRFIDENYKSSARFEIDYITNFASALEKIATPLGSPSYNIAIIDNILDTEMSLDGGCGRALVRQIIEKNKQISDESMKCKVVFCSADTNFKRQETVYKSTISGDLLGVPLELKGAPDFYDKIFQMIRSMIQKDNRLMGNN